MQIMEVWTYIKKIYVFFSPSSVRPVHESVTSDSSGTQIGEFMFPYTWV